MASYEFYRISLRSPGDPTQRLSAGTDFFHAIESTSRFLEECNELSIVGLTLPLEELDLFATHLGKLLKAIKNKTGFLFAPVVLQRSLSDPQRDFMVLL